MRNKLEDAVSHDMPSTPRETSDWTENCVRVKTTRLSFL